MHSAAMPISAPTLPRSLPALAVSFPVRISGFLLSLLLSLVRSVPTWGDRARERMKMRRARDPLRLFPLLLLLTLLWLL